jgi:hypothetical protein
VPLENGLKSHAVVRNRRRSDGAVSVLSLASADSFATAEEYDRRYPK